MWTGEGQREGDTESETGSRLWAVSKEPYAGLELTDREIMTWAEVGCLTDWATQAPRDFKYIKGLLISYAKILFEYLRKTFQQLILLLYHFLAFWL